MPQEAQGMLVGVQENFHVSESNVQNLGEIGERNMGVGIVTSIAVAVDVGKDMYLFKIRAYRV